MTNSTIKLLQENIKKFRKTKNLTQAKLSLLTNISKDYITAIECGKRTPSLKRLILIAQALEVDIRELFTPQN
ncbi:MAG TPA: helix-turn-helix transcriptional regulator [Candidatus Limenecus avicola]|jgi:hypothetical protein|uniref:Helix-turn-helix transcriptional regulator n=1 Tax=Candidatus Limenecus avicola TaxID=2840847 RepID=A0A9D1SRE1_9CLOT|nr:putative uncharacterized protein [Clostridium sp. CAG:306]HIU92635.1 helix-turn-helix transcriptional regulator [Candidatus Limenecus avicola]